MIVTCPGCAANYRVRNEAVPGGGAKMRCPRCGTVFLALSPEGGEESGPVPAGVPAPVPLEPAPATGSGVTFPAPPGTGGAASKHRVSTDMSQLLGGGGPANVELPAGDLFPGASIPPTGARGPGPDPFNAGVGQSPNGGPPPQVAIVDDAGDPFANLDLSQPPPVTGLDDHAPQLLQIQEELGEQPEAPNSGLGLVGQAIKPKPSPPPPPGKKEPEGPMLGAFIASWIVFVLGTIVFAGGGLFAAWTFGMVPLDRPLMPFVEENFGIHPPISALGKDAPDPVRIRNETDAAVASGDLVEAATGWRRLGALREDALAKAQLEALLAKLQHRGLLD